MKIILVLFTLAVLAISQAFVTPGRFTLMGSIQPHDLILKRGILYQPPAFNQTQRQDLVFTGKPGTLITCIQAREISYSRDAAVFVAEGTRPLRPNATVRATSRGTGFHFEIYIFGR